MHSEKASLERKKNAKKKKKRSRGQRPCRGRTRKKEAFKGKRDLLDCSMDDWRRRGELRSFLLFPLLLLSLCAVQYYSVNERKREKKKRNKESVKVNVISSIRHARSLARSMIERRRDELFCSFLLFPLALSLSLARSDDLSHVFESDHVLSVTPLIRTSVEALQVLVLVV